MEAIDWNYAISTLILRFVGVFVVLGILQIFMQITGRIFVYLDRREEKRSKRAPSSSSSEELTPEQVAAVAVALYMHDKQK